MTIDEVPQELRPVAETVLSEFRAACSDGNGNLAWLADYEVLELRAPRLAAGEDLEVYLPRPLVEDLAKLGLAARKQVLEELRAIPGRAREGEGHWWLVGEQGRARPLPRRPFI